MTDRKHTPGPWTGKGDLRNDELENFYIEAGDVGILGACGCCEGVHVSPEDASLIVCAPDLLADLELAAETLRRYEGYHRAKGTVESLNKADANQALAMRFEETIRKARGE
jgi:hypothetical protein